MADNPYTSQSISGYNSNPPPDDGTQVSDNEITWAKHKTKLADPVKTLAEAIDTAVTAFGNSTINTGDDQDNQMTGSLAFGSSELTIASGSVAATRTFHTIDTEADAAADDLSNITTASVSDGAVLVIRAQDASHVVTVKNEAGGAGQIHLSSGADFILDDTEKRLILQRDGADWYEPNNSDTGAVLQVVPVQKTDSFTTTSTTAVDVTDVSGAITLRNASNHVVVFVMGTGSSSNTNANAFFFLDRDGTDIGIGDAAGSRVRASFGFGHGGGTEGNYASSFAFCWRDTPGSVGPHTVKLQVAAQAGTIGIGRTATDTDAATFARYATQMLLMEVAA